MKNLCLFFQIHHPFSFQTFRFFDIGESKSYYDDLRIERDILNAVSNYYLPVNNYLLKLIHQYKGNLKISFNISDTALDQFLIYAPKLCTSFRQLADTGQVEFTGGTSSHSIVSLAHNKNEFIQSIKLNQARTEYYFGQKPKLFVNTDLIFNNQIAKIVTETGYPAILTNGTKKILKWQSPNYLYTSEDSKRIRILFRNEKVSNEFSASLVNPNKVEARREFEDFFATLDSIPPDEPITNIYLNYKSLGGINKTEKQRLFQTFVTRIIKNATYCFSLPSKIIEDYGSVSEIGTDETVCWNESFHSEYYPGNELQKDAIRQLFKLAKKVESTNNNNLKIDWRYLQSSDHFHLMDENHPDYQNITHISTIFKSKYDAYINYMNILADFKIRLKNNARVEKLKSHSRILFNEEESTNS